MHRPDSPKPTTFLADMPDNFGHYHDIIKASGATSSRVGSTFEATLTAHNSPGLMLFDRQVAGVEHRRDAAQIRRDGFEHFHLQVLRSGMLAGGTPGDERSLFPGDAILLDTTQPQHTIVTAADYVTVILSRQLADAIVPDANRLHGRVLPRTTSYGVGDAVLSLARCVSGPDITSGAGGGRMVAELLAKIAGNAGSPCDGSAEEIEASKRLQAQLFIDTHIRRADLDVNTVARGAGMSRSFLYRVFEPVGGVEREIIRRRVAHLRSTLLRPSETRSIETLAGDLGFANASHGSRAFSAAYGVRPGRLRAELRKAERASNGSLQVGHMQDWYGDLDA